MSQVAVEPQDALLVICQYGGEFVASSDGSLSYDGGEAHAIDITQDMSFSDLKAEIAHMFESDDRIFTVKYFLPNNKKTLITISNDRDLKRMMNFHKSSSTTDLYVMDKVEKRITRSSTGAIAKTSSHPSTTTLAPTTSSPPLPEEDDEEEFTPGRMTGEWANAITGPGQEFQNSRDMRDSLRMYAIAKGFAYRFIKNDNSRVTAACKVDGCPWRIHASLSSSKKKFLIKKITAAHTHTCGRGSAHKGTNRLASQQWLSNLIKEKLRESPHLKPRDIKEEFYKDFGINLNYSQAWRGKEIARRELYNSHSEACAILPWLCKRILETNPGSFATLVTKDDLRFQRVFVSFHASLHGFEHGCRPLLFLNGLDLKMNKNYRFLSATAVDGENEIFPVAFAVVEDESQETWHWFLELLKLAISSSRALTFVSERRNGLDKAVDEVFEGSEHALSFDWLMESFKAELDGLMVQDSRDTLIGDFKKAAGAYTVEEFDACVERIRSVSGDLATWVGNSKPELWSNAFFKGTLYDRLSSNAATVLFEEWIPVKDQSSVVQIIDVVRCKMMETIHLRRESSNEWVETTVLVPSAERKLRSEMEGSHPMDVVCLAENVFEVREASRVSAVNVETWECTCRRWRGTGLPCGHAIAVFDRTGASVYDFCSEYLTARCYRMAYANSLNPIPDVGRPVCPDPVHGKSMLVSRARRLPGRPRGKAVEELTRTSKRKIKCSVCNEVGHNKATCKAATANSD
ncbi:hypothetical protein QJS10_CPB14g01144 [Acorus calamus]|uniref:SWIM-type domain-containing protein n=1 Tax=Acorus calamus TaxID=4465 RepID=A0AAV9DB99_ACOCL|nr:hypothetical protein QJS10_CPB14g01144 [Acorus calamus]